MAQQQYANHATTTLAADISDTATTLTLTSATNFPSLGVDEWFMMHLVKNDGTKEIVKCTDISGTTCTIVRAQEGTSGIAHTLSPVTIISVRLTAGTLERFEQGLEDLDTAEATIVTNTSDIATNTAGVATNASDISDNTDDITTNTAGIATNVSDISDNADNLAAVVDGSTQLTTTKCSVYMAGDQHITGNTTELLALDTEHFDTKNEFTSNTFTAKQAGYYNISAQTTMDTVGAGHQYILKLYISGVSRVEHDNRALGASLFMTLPLASKTFYLGVGATVQLYLYASVGTYAQGGQKYTFLDIVRIP